MTLNIIIPNLEKLEKIKEAIKKDGAEKLHILSDFDKTLTTAFIGGKAFASFISILRDGNYLTPDYAGKAHALYNKYRPIEIDPKISFEEKKNLMHEWWSAHFALLIKSGLNKRDIKKAAESGKAKLRGGFDKFAGILRANNIPLVIISSSGMGDEAISMYLEKEGKLNGNIFIISNAFEWDNDGNAIGFKQPIVHSLNKSETLIKYFPFYSKIKDRKNIIFLGDSLDDIAMAQGLDCDNLIKIGFLNENVEENLEKYKENFDVVLLGDAPMDYINQFLKEVLPNN